MVPFMVWFLIGLLALFLVISGLKWLSRADRKQAGMAAAALVVALLIGLGLVLLLTGKLYPALTALGSALAGLWRMRWLAGLLAGPALKRARRTSTAGNAQDPRGSTGTVETSRLQLTVDENDRVLDGLVLTGSFAGRSLSGLEFGEILALLEELESSDMEGARYLEGFLEQTRGADWRERTRYYGKSRSHGQHRKEERRTRTQSGMSREEALHVLGLGDDADASAVKAAHRRLMKRVHPDQGGSGYFASKLNEARDVLLNKQERT